MGGESRASCVCGAPTGGDENHMAYKITDECLACGACVDECPNEAISEDDPIYIIDAEKCDDCATCVESCPSEAIVPE
jgi:ferredoxin